LLFEVFSQRYERGSTLVTSNLPFDEWTSVVGSERLTGALLEWLTHHVRILEKNGESFCLAQRRIQPAHIIAWSPRRRAHQAAAQIAHINQKMQL
jgi:DNA replication protein DnaC